MRCETCHKEAPYSAVFCPYCGNALGEAPDNAPSDAPNLADYEYAAFISYRHVPRDQEIAKYVQKAIETYRLPRNMATGAGENQQRLGKCFRDEDELPASHSLPERILDAIDKSSSLIVICSPDARDSVWIDREIKAFVEMHGRNRIFTVLANGSSAESMPAALQIEETVIGGSPIRSNPLAADLRPEASGKRLDETLRIIAAIAGYGFDDLRQRDKQRRRKQRAIAAAIVAALIAIIAILVAFAAHSYQDAQISESRKLAEESIALLKSGDRYGAIETALEALPDPNTPLQRPLVEEAQQALVTALEIDPGDQLRWQPSYLIELDNDANALVTEKSQNWFAVLDSSITISTFDSCSGKKLASFTPLNLVEDESYIDFDSQPQCWKLIPAGQRVIVCECTGSGIIAAYDAKTGNREWEYSPLRIRAASTSFNGQVLELFGLDKDNMFGAVVDASSDEPLTAKTLENPAGEQLHRYFLPIASNEEGSAFVGMSSRIVGFEFAKDTPTATISDEKDLFIESICLAEDSIVASSASKPNDNAKTLSDLERKYRFECLDLTMKTLWSFSGNWTPRVEGEGNGIHVVPDAPKAHGIANLDRPCVICTVGDSLLLFDNASGELLYSEQFGSTVVSAGTDGLSSSKYGDTIVVACANGSVNFRRPFLSQGDNSHLLNFSFPTSISTSSLEWSSNEKLLAIATSYEKPNQIVCYHLDMRGIANESSGSSDGLLGPLDSNSRYLSQSDLQNSKPASAYSLEELISLAKQTLAEGGR